MAFNIIPYLREHFPLLDMEGGLFYQWPVGIRFDLGRRAKTDGDFAEVARRATLLFEVVFGPEDRCVVVAQEWPREEGTNGFQQHLSCFSDFAAEQDIRLGEPSGCVEVTDLGEEKRGIYTLIWFEQLRRNLRYRLILTGIANADHARQPALGARVHFINPRTNVIVHMYDDRGLDVIASCTDALVSLYRDFNTWILDYDRAKIEAIFDGSDFSDEP